MTDCLFCKIAAGEIPATIVHEDARTLAFMDIHPIARGHCLVIPRAHSADLLAPTPRTSRPARARCSCSRDAPRRRSAPTA